MAVLPRGTVRMRLTLLFGSLFLASGAGLLTVTYLLVQHGWFVQKPVHPGGTPSPAGQDSAASSVPDDGARQAHVVSGQVRVGMIHQRDSDLHQFLVQSILALALMAVVSVVLGWIVAGRVLRPLRTITRATQEISASSLHRRLDLTGPRDEFKELGDTIDGLLGRLERSFRSQRQFVANASHELRTPLARQRALVQVALSDPDATMESMRAAHERVLASNSQQAVLIEALLTLARSDGGGLSRHEAFDLAAVVERVSTGRAAEAERRGLLLAAALEPAPVEGDPHLVERLVANLIDNALRHNRSHGRVEVATAAADAGAVLTVTNTGSTVPADAIERLFLPFQRLGADRTSRDGGVGLGLSIVRAIATAHDATVTARPRPGGGLGVTVTFPLAVPG